MAGLWLFKTEPSEYSYHRLEKEGRALWDGVTNALALRNLRQVRKGDSILFYHTGDERAVVAVARAASDACPDPKDRAGRLVVVDVEPERRLPRPVGLAEIKARRDMADFDLVRLGRLSVMPVSRERWDAILEMSRAPAPAGRATGPVARPASARKTAGKPERSARGGARRRAARAETTPGWGKGI